MAARSRRGPYARGMARSGPIRRVSLARTGILIALLVVAVLAFAPFLGPFRILFRGVLVVGALALAASYLWPWLQRLIGRGRS